MCLSRCGLNWESRVNAGALPEFFGFLPEVLFVSSELQDSFFFFLNFTILYKFCQISKWIRHRYTHIPHPEPSSLLPSLPYPPSGSSQCTSPKHPVPCIEQPRCPSADKWIRKLWYIYTMEYYSAIKKNTFESVLMRWMKLEPIIQSEASQKEKHQYSILTHIYGI